MFIMIQFLLEQNFKNIIPITCVGVSVNCRELDVIKHVIVTTYENILYICNNENNKDAYKATLLL